MFENGTALNVAQCMLACGEPVNPEPLDAAEVWLRETRIIALLNCSPKVGHQLSNYRQDRLPRRGGGSPIAEVTNNWTSSMLIPYRAAFSRLISTVTLRPPSRRSARAELTAETVLVASSIKLSIYNILVLPVPSLIFNFTEKRSHHIRFF